MSLKFGAKSGIWDELLRLIQELKQSPKVSVRWLQVRSWSLTLLECALEELGIPFSAVRCLPFAG